MFEIAYDEEMSLSAPEGVEAILVTVEIAPIDAGFVVYGHNTCGDLQSVQVKGCSARVELPFCRPRVWIQHLGEVTSLKVSTLGWRHPRATGEPAARSH
jgi:hypothetical protein